MGELGAGGAGLDVRYECQYIYRMKTEKKITVLLPEDLLERALKASGEGITPTLRKGLELVAAKDTYKGLLKLKGKFDLKMNLDDLRKDRDE